MSAYDDVLSIKKFAGINQCNDGHNTDMSYAVSGINFDTSYGGLKPFCYAVPLPETTGMDTSVPVPASAKGFTLAFLVKRWQYNSGVLGRSDSYGNAFAIMIAGGRIYYRKKNLNTFSGVAWTELMNGANHFNFTNSKFDTVSYEINHMPPVALTQSIVDDIYAGTASYVVFDKTNGFNYYQVKSDDGVLANAYYTTLDGEDRLITDLDSVYRKVREEVESAPVDCLLITNEQDGMYCIYAPLETNTLKIAPVHVGPLDHVESVLCGAIARHDDRIWVGAISTDPDKLMYCSPKDVFNWEQDGNDPANGAGDIQQPTWDGDEIIAIKEFGANLLVAKKHSIWRITGSDPSEYTYKRQYGEGTISEDSFAVNGAYAYMLTDDDVKVYDGNSTYHLRYGYVKDLLLNQDATRNSGEVNIGRMLQDKYVLQIYHTVYGGLLLIFNTVEGTVNACLSQDALALETYEAELYGLYPEHYSRPTGHSDDDTLPAEGDYIQFGKYLTEDGAQMNVSWTSAWIDLNAKNVVKSGFNVYIMFDSPNAQADSTITATLSMISEKKTKSKTITIPYRKVKRVRLNCNGREYKLKLEIDAQNYMWQIATGIQIYVEYDAD